MPRCTETNKNASLRNNDRMQMESWTLETGKHSLAINKWKCVRNIFHFPCCAHVMDTDTPNVEFNASIRNWTNNRIAVWTKINRNKRNIAINQQIVSMYFDLNSSQASVRHQRSFRLLSLTVGSCEELQRSQRTQQDGEYGIPDDRAWLKGFDILSQHEHLETTGVYHTNWYAKRSLSSELNWIWFETVSGFAIFFYF